MDTLSIKVPIKDKHNLQCHKWHFHIFIFHVSHIILYNDISETCVAFLWLLNIGSHMITNVSYTFFEYKVRIKRE